MSMLNLTGYHLTYDQEFSNPSAFQATPNGSSGSFKTQYDWGGRTVSSNHEAEYYSDPSLGTNPFSVQNGALTITAQNATAGQNTNGLPYTSGMITTQTSFAQNEGYFEIRAELPAGQGAWPAFWMLPVSGTDYPEIDIMEDPNLGPPGQYWVHATAPSDGGGGFIQTGTPLNTGYHTYGVMWTASAITFYFDGNPVGAYITPSALANEKMYMIANLAIGGAGSWPGSAAASTIPAQYHIDYIRAFSNNPADPAVAQQPISSPDGANTTPVLTAQPIPSVTTGSGPDSLVLQVTEDSYNGDAQFTVSIDGVQQGQVFTAIGSHSLDQPQSFIFNGSFSSSNHVVSVNFLNDAYGGNSSLDRNLYINSATIDGSTISGATLNETLPGPQSFSFFGAGATTAVFPAITLGSGPDTLALNISEDAYLGNAQFTISVDGTQIGGVQNASAAHGAGQTQIFDVLGSFAAGAHNVSVNFLNDAYGGSPSADRNLYVGGATIDGVTVANSTLNEYSGGAQSFAFSGASTTAPAFPVVTLGSGPDTLALSMSEDAYLGNALFTVSVDGTQIGGTQTTAALHGEGQSQIFDVLGSFAAGAHNVSVNFLNDAYGGSPSADRNLYVGGATIDGVAVPNSTLNEYSGGAQGFSFSVPGSTPPPAAAPTIALGTGPDMFQLGISEDAYLGNAQFAIAVDGTQVGGVQTASALHDIGATQLFDVSGSFGAGSHTIAIDFLNDAYGGSPSADRNLYVDSLSYNGVMSPNNSAALMNGGPAYLDVPATNGAAPDSITFNLTEDAYQGNAIAKLSLDGATLGTPTVTALNSGGIAQAFTYSGDFGPGPHLAVVDFLNDAYGGSPSADRNLYVKSIAYDGTIYSNLSASLMTPGPVGFTIPLGQHPS